MAEFIFITGGARSGKSRFAEQLLAGRQKVLYIATAVACDGEMEERIRRHRSARDAAWQTLEAFSGIGEKLRPLLPCITGILLDCLTLMLSNLMLRDRRVHGNTISRQTAGEIEQQIATEIDNMLAVMQEFTGRVVIVSNEVGMGLVPEYPLGRCFRDLAGRCNQKIAALADQVYFMVSGLPLKMKG